MSKVCCMLARILLKMRCRLAGLCGAKVRIIVGSGGRRQLGWLSTDKDVLDLTDEEDWEYLFSPCQVDKICAEHVFEHLTEDAIVHALKIIHRYLKHGGILRIAVPDANHPSGYVRELTKPDGLEPGADDHKVFLNIDSMRRFATLYSYQLKPIEYFDGDGVFHSSAYSDADGHINRCSKEYKGRFTKKKDEYEKFLLTTPPHLRPHLIDAGVTYTSLIVDLIK